MAKKNISKLITEIYPNIFKIILPMPGDKPGPVNVYLFTGEDMTLLDTGTVKTFDLLRKAFAENGSILSDLDQIVISHGHIDHFGAAMKIVNESCNRVKVSAHLEDVRRIETGSDIPDEVVSDFLKLMDMPVLFQKSLKLMRSFFRSLADNCRVDMILQDNAIIRMGNYNGRVISTPGHSKGSICIYLENENILFSGDTILNHITPNAFVMLETDSKFPIRLSQREFYNSLSRVESLSPSMVCPGHGDEISDIKKVVDLYRNEFSLRQKMILSILESGDYTIYKIARKLFPEIKGKKMPLDLYLGVSEVFTHSQILHEEKRIEWHLERGKLMIGLN